MQVMSVDEVPTMGQVLGFGGGRPIPVRWRGTVALATPGAVPFPVLLNGRRVRLPALHLRGDFTARQGRWQPEFWVLADSTYPLILKWIGAFRETGNVLQTTRIDLPLAVLVLDDVAEGDSALLAGGDGLLLAEGGALAADAGATGVAGGGATTAGGGGARPGGAGAAALERALTASCRVELPGIYFAFNSATLDPASDRTIAALAGILARHPDWKATLEGHTDSIGSAAANQALSERRVEAVRVRLVEAHQLDPARLRVAGHGAMRPREPNATIEGRARNRRVELVREC
jgi:outer membrane protein OmpA-like peptidoglycan-associated protein